MIARPDVEKAVYEYGRRLGLNTTETADVLRDIQSRVTSNYVFVSFYSQEVSKRLLPITFNPHPDTYINYIFYVKNLNSPYELGYSPASPRFPDIVKRGAVTAVEVSVLAE